MNRRNRFPLFLLAALFLAPLPALSAQETGAVTGAAESELEKLLESALQAAESGEWERAVQALDDAEKIAGDDPRISSYRVSIMELYELELAQRAWSEGESTEVGTVDPGGRGTDSDPAEDETPKFVIDRGDKDPADDPARNRDNFRADLSLKVFAVDPLTSETVNTWSSGNEFLYSSLRVDLRYWMPFLGRSLGFSLRSNGYSLPPGTSEFLFNTVDAGINLRGFLLEKPDSRLEIGIDFGASLQSVSGVSEGKSSDFALFLGLWASDPVLFHLFRADSLENIVFGGGIRIYSTLGDEPANTANYRADGALNFDSGFAGVRLEWWEVPLPGERDSMLSFSLFGGYRF
jgi:hypothetical protein